MLNSLRQKITSGIIWASMGQFGSQLIHYLVLLILAWLLSPADFGLLGLAMVFILVTQDLGELGLAAALIQHKDATEPVLSTAFWSNFALSIIIAGFSWSVSGLIATFLGSAELAPILKVLAVIFPVTALGVVPIALLKRKLQFKQLAVRQFVAEVCFGVVGLTMAVTGAGVWSLVGATVAQRIGSTVILWGAVSWRPKLIFNFSEFIEPLKFGVVAMFSVMINRGLSQVDYFIIGRWLGTEQLGWYVLAFQLAVIPVQRLVDVFQRVAFPALVTVHEDTMRLRSGFLEGLKYLFLILSPVSLFLLVLGPKFIETIYDDRWLPAANLVGILAITGVFYGFDVTEALYFAVGQPKLRVGAIALRLWLFVGLVAGIGLAQGINGVAWSLVLSVIISSFFNFVLASRILELPPRFMIQPVWPAMRAVFFAATPALALLFEPSFVSVSPWVLLCGIGMAMGLIYLLTTFPLYRSSLEQLLAKHFPGMLRK